MCAAQAKPQEIFEKYISEKKVLIADTGATSRSSLANMIVSMGAKSTNILLASTFENAIEEIDRNHPSVVICDYDLGNRCGLDLLQSQRQQRPESKDCLFILVTGNTSQSAVAQAAEEDVDMFVLKPYTPEVLRNSIMRAAVTKISPPDYIKKIETGKKKLFSGAPEEAMSLFKEATTMDPKPSLAWFYYGQAYLMKQATEQAQGSYQKGLEFNKIHYKCLIGLFDLLMSRKRHAEAYDVVKKISRYFPANPQRLTTVVRLAIMTRSFEDIERYYQAFTDLDARNDELITYISAALVVCGKYYLQKDLQSRALPLFDKAARTAVGRLHILREIISSLLAMGMVKEGQEFLKRFPPESRSSVDFLTVEFQIADQTQAAAFVVGQGRKLIQKGISDPQIYRIMIRRSKEIGVVDSAEALMHEAGEKWPDLVREFERIFMEARLNPEGKKQE